MFDHPPRVLVSHGRIMEGELRRAGLTMDDLHGLLRQHGIVALADVEAAIFEQRGKISILKQTVTGGSQPELLRQFTAPVK